MSKLNLFLLSLAMFTIVIVNFIINREIVRTPMGAFFIIGCCFVGGLAAGLAKSKK